MSNDWIAFIAFVALFVLMLLRVPVGMAMGLVGVSGYAYLSGGGPALKLIGQTSMRTVTDYQFGVIPMWPFYAVAWVGDVAAVFLIAIRTWRLAFNPQALVEVHEEAT